MTEVASPLTFEDSSWEKISHYEVQSLPQKFGKTFGVGRKVAGGKTLFSAKLPAQSSATGKTVKLGLFPTSDEASAAVQYALQNPGFYFQDVDEIKQHIVPVRETEIIEPSFCERIIPIKREYKEKQIRKQNALAKKSLQKESQVHIGEDFLKSIQSRFDNELKNIKSWSRFQRALETNLLNLSQEYFPRKGDINNEMNKNGACDFAKNALVQLWRFEQEGKEWDEWSIASVEDFIQLTLREESILDYGNWIKEKIFDSMQD